MFTVGYVPLGMDAAVSYGYADLVFKNTLGHPLIINASVSKDNYLKIEIRSTDDYPDLKVKLASDTIRTIDPSVEYIDDPSLPVGSEVISENGMAGYVVDTYMKIFNGDSLIREEKLHRSVYQMLPKKILRGASSN
jgi:vancomycin resistance protein YoaR